MNKSESIAKLAAALVKAQLKIGSAKKGSANPFFKSSYADLGAVVEALKDPLNEAGISYLQIVGRDELGTYVETTLIHESGEFISGQTPVIIAKANDPQAVGSAITYARRYGLQAMLGIPAEDDDGEKAMGRGAAKQSAPIKSSIKNTDKSFAPRGNASDDDFFN